MKDYLLDNLVIILTFLSSLVLLWQLILLRKQTQKDHDRSRRMVVLDLQKLWIEHCGTKARFIRKLLPFLNNEMSAKVWDDDAIEIDARHKDILCDLLDCEGEKLDIREGTIMVSGANLMKFRTHLANYLNLLEIIFTAWLDNVGDRGMIEREFGKNISSDNRNFILDPVINCIPQFPSIKLFTQHLRELGTDIATGRKAL